MNIKELAEQAGFTQFGGLIGWWSLDSGLERFAELIRQDEREACAKLCEDGVFLHDQAPDALFGKEVAKAIRARNNHE